MCLLGGVAEIRHPAVIERRAGVIDKRDAAILGDGAKPPVKLGFRHRLRPGEPLHVRAVTLVVVIVAIVAVGVWVACRRQPRVR